MAAAIDILEQVLTVLCAIVTAFFAGYLLFYAAKAKR